MTLAEIHITSSRFSLPSLIINENDFPALASLDENALIQALTAGVRQGIVMSEQSVQNTEVKMLRNEVQRVQQTLEKLHPWFQEWIPQISGSLQEAVTHVVQQTLDPYCTSSDAYRMIQGVRDAMHPDIIASTVKTSLSSVIEPILSQAIEPSMRMMTNVLTDWTKQMGHDQGVEEIIEKSPQKGFILEDCIEEWLNNARIGCDNIIRTGTVVQEGGTGKKGDFCIDIDPVDCKEGTRIVIEAKSALPNGKQSWNGKTGYEGYLRQAIQQRGASFGILVVSSRDAMNVSSRAKLKPFYMLNNMLFCSCDNCGDIVVPLAYWFARQRLRFMYKNTNEDVKTCDYNCENDITFSLSQLKQFSTMKGTLTKIEESCTSQCFLLRKQINACEQDLKSSLQTLQRKICENRFLQL